MPDLIMLLKKEGENATVTWYQHQYLQKHQFGGFKVLESDLCLNPEEIITNLMESAKTVNKNGIESAKWILGIRICRAGGVPRNETKPVVSASFHPRSVVTHMVENGRYDGTRVEQ